MGIEEEAIARTLWRSRFGKKCVSLLTQPHLPHPIHMNTKDITPKGSSKNVASSEYMCQG